MLNIYCLLFSVKRVCFNVLPSVSIENGYIEPYPLRVLPLIQGETKSAVSERYSILYLTHAISGVPFSKGDERSGGV